MPDPKTDRDAPRDAAEKPDAGAQAQADEAKDEGAGQASVPIEQVTTQNDE